MAIPTYFCRQWKRFRDHLTNGQRDNLSAIINAELLSGNIREGLSRIVIVTPAPRAAVTVYLQGGTLFLVGGHWIRHGEPNRDYLQLIRRDISRIKAGLLP